MASVPVALWNLKVPSGGVKVPGYDDENGAPLPYRITMAAIDSSRPSTKPSTLKLHKRIVTLAPSSDEEDEEEKMDEGESTEEEFVICTLEAGKIYQQPLDLTMPEDDEVYFSATGDLPIYLSGNYVTPIPMDSDDESDEDEEYDLSPDEDELDDLDYGESDLSDLDDEDEDEDEDELDDLKGRIEEITEEEAVKPSGKGKKRPLEEAEEAPELVDTSKDDIDTSKLSKSEKKKLKKQKLQEESKVNGSAEKKVQFATKLEQGPTTTKSPSAEPPKPALAAAAADKKREKVTLANGVVVEEYTPGKGNKAVNGTKLGIRYIGKLAKNGKEFDKNTKGKPFRFTLGKGEVIKGIPHYLFSGI